MKMNENEKILLQEKNLEMYTSNNTLNFSVTNFHEFNETLALAKKQAQELQKTLNKLYCFNFEIKLNIGDYVRD